MAKEFFTEADPERRRASRSPDTHRLTLHCGLAHFNSARLAVSGPTPYHSLGALGGVELTAPTRVKRVSDGMPRLGMNGRIRSYFDLYEVLDVHHSEAWNREVTRSLVDADPACARFIAEGALMRLLCGQRCFDCDADQLMPVALH